MTKQEVPAAESQKEEPRMSEPNLNKQVSKLPPNSGLWVARQTDKWTVKTHWPPNGEDATEDLMKWGKHLGLQAVL